MIFHRQWQINFPASGYSKKFYIQTICDDNSISTMNKKSYEIEGHSGKTISIDLSFPDLYRSLIIFVHGFKGFKDWGSHNLMANYFAENGMAFLKFNFSHSGVSLHSPDDFSDLESFGANTFTKELYDLNKVITFAQSGEQFPAPDKINLIGHSRGGGISIIQTAHDKRISKLVTWASVSRFRSLWMMEQEEKWREEGVIFVENSRTRQQMPLSVDLLSDLEQNSERLDILEAALKIKQPWLIVHSEADTTVPLEQALELNRQQRENNIFILSDSDHVFGARHPWTDVKLPSTLQRVCDTTISFFKE